MKKVMDYKRDMDYGFTDKSLLYHTTTFRDNGVALSHLTQQLLIPDMPSADSDQYDAIRHELSEEELRVASVGDHAIEYALLNHEASADNGLIVYVGGGIGGNLRHNQKRRESEIVALANPDKQIMMMNGMGAGRSTLIPRPMMKEMKRSGSYEPEGEYIAQILGPIFERYGDKIQLWGDSADARVALGIAAAFGAANQNFAGLQAVDPPGAVGRPTLGTLLRFLGQSKDTKRYGVQSPYSEKHSGVIGVVGSDWLHTMLATSDNFKNYPAAMSREGGLETDMGSALSVVKNKLTIIQPELSQFATPLQMQGMIGRVAAEHSGDAEKLRHVLIERHSHAILSADAGPRRDVLHAPEFDK